tara:strand:+ start:288 stop:2495 length:2208 start_codon:yes stop_codon:yes gene_type:complete
MADKELYKGQLEDLRQIASLKSQISRSDEIMARTSGVVKTNQEAIRKVNQDILKAKKAQVNVLKSVNQAAKEIPNLFEDGVDSLKDMASNVPIIGKYLSSFVEKRGEVAKEKLERMAGAFRQQFTSGFRLAQRKGEDFTTSLQRGLKNGMVGVQKVIGKIGGLGKAFMGAGIIALLALAVKGFMDLDSAGKAFRDSTGLLNSQTEQLQSNIRKVTMQTAALGASAEDVANAAASFTNVFEGVVQPSAATLANVVALEKNFGVAADGAAKVNLMFQSIGGLSEEAAQSLITSTAEAAKLVGVSPDRVIKDLAENAETAAMFFQGSVGDLAKAAVEAARLGTSLTQAAAVANNLLDFENSITSELEASAMLGQSINFNRARELAAAGDILGAQQAVLDNLEENVNLNELNTFQLQSIAKASGMEVGELQKQLEIRKKFGGLNANQQKALEALAAKGNEIKDISEDQLKSETARIAKQQEFQSQVDQIKNQFGALGTEIGMALMPLIKLTIPVLKGVVGLFKLILSPVTFLATQLGNLVEFMTKFKDVTVAAGVGFATVLGIQKRSVIQSKLQLGYEMAKNAVTTAYNGLITFGNTIKKKGLLTSVYEMASSAFASVAKIPFIGPILGAAAAAGALALGMGYIGKADDMFSPGGGSGYGSRMITSGAGTLALNNNDDVVAGTNLMGGGGGGAVVSAIEKLGADIRALQVVVNMDGKRVSDGVSKVVSRNQTNSAGVTV